MRGRSESFGDHYSQARLFWNSQSEVEQEHIIAAYTFELSKVQRPHIRERVIREILPNIDIALARAVGDAHGIEAPSEPPASAEDLGNSSQDRSEALSLMHRLPGDIRHRKVAILAADGVDGAQVSVIREQLEKQGATAMVITPTMAAVRNGSGGDPVQGDAMLNGQPSVTVDAVIVPGGADSAGWLADSGAGRYYLQEAFKHLKVIALLGDARSLVETAALPSGDEGIVLADRFEDAADQFAGLLGQHRVWSRNANANDMPA